MDQLRLDFKLNFFFLKNLKLDLCFYTFFINPLDKIDYYYLPEISLKPESFNKFLFRKVVEIDNSKYFYKKLKRVKVIKCKKIFVKNKYFVNLLYF